MNSEVASTLHITGCILSVYIIVFQWQWSSRSASEVLENAMQVMPVETHRRLQCPLCRCPWPDEDKMPLAQLMSQLRLCRTRQVAKLTMKLEILGGDFFLKANIEAMVLDPKTKDKNLEWLILCSHYFLSKQIANKDSIPECAASFWWKRRSCPVSFRIRFIQAGTTSSYCLQFLELSTHRLRACGTDVNISGCAACDQHVSCMCAFGGIKLSLASRSLTGVLVECGVVFHCFSMF